MRLTPEELKRISLEATQKRTQRKATPASYSEEDSLELKRKLEPTKLQRRVATEAEKDAIWDQLMLSAMSGIQRPILKNLKKWERSFIQGELNLGCQSVEHAYKSNLANGVKEEGFEKEICSWLTGHRDAKYSADIQPFFGRDLSYLDRWDWYDEIELFELRQAFLQKARYSSDIDLRFAYSEFVSFLEMQLTFLRNRNNRLYDDFQEQRRNGDARTEVNSSSKPESGGPDELYVINLSNPEKLNVYRASNYDLRELYWLSQSAGQEFISAIEDCLYQAAKAGETSVEFTGVLSISLMRSFEDRENYFSLRSGNGPWQPYTYLYGDDVVASRGPPPKRVMRLLSLIGHCCKSGTSSANVISVMW